MIGAPVPVVVNALQVTIPGRSPSVPSVKALGNAREEKKLILVLLFFKVGPLSTLLNVGSTDCLLLFLSRLSIAMNYVLVLSLDLFLPQ